MNNIGLSSDLIRNFGIWVGVSLVLVVLSYFVDLKEATWPMEKGLMFVEGQVGRGIETTSRPAQVIGYWQDGLQRTADLEQRLNDTIVDKARLERLEAEVKTLRQMQGLAMIDENDILLSQALKTDEGMLISVGERDGISQGMIVINEEGVLIGKVREVGKFSSKLQVPSEINEKIAVTLAGKQNIRAVLVGDGGGVELTELLQEAEVELGDVVETSGEDDVYPSGLVVAQVTQVNEITSAVTKTAGVELVGELGDLVVVIK